MGRRWEFVLTKTITKRIWEASDPRTAGTSEICMAAATEQAGRRPAEGGCKATAGRGDFPLKSDSTVPADTDTDITSGVAAVNTHII